MTDPKDRKSYSDSGYDREELESQGWPCLGIIVCMVILCIGVYIVFKLVTKH